MFNRSMLVRYFAHRDGLVELMLFEDSNYPKVDKKGERKRGYEQSRIQEREGEDTN